MVGFDMKMTLHTPPTTSPHRNSMSAISQPGVHILQIHDDLFPKFMRKLQQIHGDLSPKFMRKLQHFLVAANKFIMF